MDSLDQQDGLWSINNGQASAEHVFLVTGSHPKDESPYPSVACLALDDALIPKKLAGAQTVRLCGELAFDVSTSGVEQVQ